MDFKDMAYFSSLGLDAGEIEALEWLGVKTAIGKDGRRGFVIPAGVAEHISNLAEESRERVARIRREKLSRPCVIIPSTSWLKFKS